MQVLINDYDFEFLQTLSDPIRAVQTMLLTKLLSSHAMDEVYLRDGNKWILVCTVPPFLLSKSARSPTQNRLPVLEHQAQEVFPMPLGSI